MLKSFKIISFTCFIAVSLINAQHLDGTNYQALYLMAHDLKIKSLQNKQKAESLVKEKNLPVRSFLSNNIFFELQEIWQGRLLYNITTNLNAAKTVSTDKVWPGQASGLNLDGTGMIIAEWDGGAVRISHQEFSSSGMSRVIQRDGATGDNAHATHVAGTLIAAGADSNAKGMAPNARLYAYDWTSAESEMATEAASGLLFSNHSYSIIAGWIYNYRGDGLWTWFGFPSINPTEDFLFGFYLDTARQWDEIAYNAPYYLIVAAAGNDRNDTGPPGGTPHWVRDNWGNWSLSTAHRKPDGDFDCIPGPAVAKNILTVGAVEDITSGYSGTNSVIMSSMSSWGPTDDGRIKPDLVANGIALTSSWSTGDDRYETLSGTSMAAPNVTGSLTLIQQHHHDLRGIYLKSAALKALVIHTADEAGASLGPDYAFGWGLLNTDKATRLISQDQTAPHTIQEFDLLQNEIFEWQVQSNGTEPIKLTITWTDPPGSPPSITVDPPTPMLVNDLDLRLIHNQSQVAYFPWRLDKDNPAAGANQTDNSVDNIEQIYVPYPTTGSYTVRVTHKNLLQNGHQNFALICTGLSELSETPKLHAKILLEGPYNPVDHQMSTNLLTLGQLPLTSPYQEDPRTIPCIADDICDWVLLQLRQAGNSSAFYSKSLLLRKDGQLMDGDGSQSDITVVVPPGDYNLVIKHRNHLGVMSCQPITFFNNTTSSYDFSSAAGQAIGINSLKELQPGIWGLWAGDFDQDGELTTTDYIIWFNEAKSGYSGYQAADTNMDTQVITSDYISWYNNALIGISCNIPN